jgi:hypothetical protein
MLIGDFPAHFEENTPLTAGAHPFSICRDRKVNAPDTDP